MKQKMIDFLLENANPSIKLRVKKEILKNITKREETRLQEQILEEKIIRFIAEKQLENGWIGLGFHGSNKDAGQYDNQEVATKYMGEKGLKGTKLLDRAMDAYVTTKLTDLCYGTRGQFWNEFEVPAQGSNLVRCACIARAHYLPELREEVEFVVDNINSDGICSVGMYDGEFRGWSPYFGAQLETDWRAKIRRQCDITFRALLIIHYSGIMPD